MSASTSIEWTDATWNPLRVRQKTTGKIGQHCERVSEGCRSCYAATWNRRNLPNGGTGLDYTRGSRDVVEPFVDERVLTQPLRWREPRRIFVANQTDLFGDWYTDEQRDCVFAVMALAQRHTFQVLTKRPERMREYLSSADRLERLARLMVPSGTGPDCREIVADEWVPKWVAHARWPLPNVHLGVSVEDQKTADARIPVLLDTPAALRWISLEPMLGAVSIERALCSCAWPADAMRSRHNLSCRADTRTPDDQRRWAGLDWIVVGGESGPRARPCDVAWIRSIVEQCKTAGTSVFVKQLGAKVTCGCGGDVGAWAKNHGHKRAECAKCGLALPLKSRKGSDPSEWPEDLRVRELPKTAGKA